MALIHLFDGTTDPRYGQALIPAFAEHAKYREIRCTPSPGGIDMLTYEIVKAAEKESWNAARGQADILQFVPGVLNRVGTEFLGAYTFTLTEKDIYAGDLNWGFGCVLPDDIGGKHLILSTHRFKDLAALTHTAIHEMGHMFGAAQPGRRNTERNLGNHCTNLCVMQQKVTVPEMEKYVALLASRQDKFCTDCQTDLRRQ